MKYALITGGASGIGFEIAKILYKNYNLVLIGRDQKNLENAKKYLSLNNLPDTALRNTFIPTTALRNTFIPTTALRNTFIPTTALRNTFIPTTALRNTFVPTTALPDTALPAQEILLLNYDLTDINSPAKIFNYCCDLQLDVEIVVNNAGFGIYAEFTNIPPEEIISMLNLNIISLTLMCNFFGSMMQNKKSGYILNIASSAAYQPVPYFAAYAASKSYALNFSEAIAKELEDYGVVVSCLSPGPTDTNFFKNAGIMERY